MTWLPFPTAVLAQHLRGADERVAALVYSGTFMFLAVAFNLLWRYAVRAGLPDPHVDVPAISRQYALGPVVYAATVAIAWFSATACLIASAAIAVYFALPPRRWRPA